MDIRDQAAVVTGAASGLGQAVARRLAAAGARVACVDLALAEALAEVIGGVALAADVADAVALETAFAAARDRHGPCRILVCCAGIGPSARILDRDGRPQPLDQFERVLRVNLLGTFNALRLAAAEMAALPALSGGERGIAVTTASIAAFEGQVGQAAYAASKGGVAALTLPAARELARHGIRVCSVAPGVFGTPMFETVKPEWREAIVGGIPFPKRAGDPDEFARLVQFLVENPMANGDVWRLDGAARLG